MVNRLVKLPLNNSFLLFGPRGSGKTTWLKAQFKEISSLFWVDLLKPTEEERYLLEPEFLERQLNILIDQNKKPEWVVIDEVQKVPKLLNLVHYFIEEKKIKFALTGSSSRKLKQKGINLLAGRAWVQHLFPFTHIEIINTFQKFDLLEALRWGTLPKVLELTQESEKMEFLSSYAQTYIKSEIQEEQWVRRIEPFRRFLPIAAQMNGKPLNYSNISKDVGVDSNTIKSYYEILEDTLLGFHLPAFDKSVRKQQRKSSKFYFFDTGIKRQLDRKITLSLAPGTSEYGDLFEHFIILEIYRLNLYYKTEYELSYLLTKDNLEIDLILDRPGKPLALIEIKSKSKVDERDTRHLEALVKIEKDSQSYLLSNDPIAQKIKNTLAFPWAQGIYEIFK